MDIDVCMCKHGCANIHLHIFEIVFNKTKWSGFYVSDTSSPALIQQDTISNACCTQEGERERELLIPHRYSGCGCVTVGVGVHTHVCICVNHRTKWRKHHPLQHNTACIFKIRTDSGDSWHSAKKDSILTANHTKFLTLLHMHAFLLNY